MTSDFIIKPWKIWNMNDHVEISLHTGTEASESNEIRYPGYRRQRICCAENAWNVRFRTQWLPCQSTPLVELSLAQRIIFPEVKKGCKYCRDQSYHIRSAGLWVNGVLFCTLPFKRTVTLLTGDTPHFDEDSVSMSIEAPQQTQGD